ncbi:hypothetical protein Micbo1qcDRAFT_157864 [Microdochium bolleyi]|uniref:Uncharacterized protein n=1 Tax=Microdochium bolleyi TaxID=196109 RepID=A0A136JF55_9PEZI|nr:hypothetical protein Micbo1qcDRAFT_157864 [Microdochium bolleyi]
MRDDRAQSTVVLLLEYGTSQICACCRSDNDKATVADADSHNIWDDLGSYERDVVQSWYAVWARRYAFTSIK